MNEEIVNRYLVGFDEINQMISTSYRMALSESDSLDEQMERVIDDLTSLLILAYQAGIADASTSLASDLTVEIDALKEALSAESDSKTYEDRVRDIVSSQDSQSLSRLAETEYHRMYNAGVFDGGEQYRRETGLGIVRRWVTMGDDRVRDTHRYLDGVSVDPDEEFFTFDGDHAPYPGKFQKAKNNVNCRCKLVDDPEEA